MGIRYLNKFLRENASDSIRHITLRELQGKKIAIDISIYMYKYAAEGQLIENIYLMLSVFRQYNIIPIFIFDGKPPTEKKALLLKRRESKQSAYEEYTNLKSLLDTDADIDATDRQDIIANMDILKRTFTYVSRTDIENVKGLIRAYGATYYDAPGEADELCALLSIKENVWACLSEDMDMFVYGCPRVIRYLSLMNRSAVLYDTKEILNELTITQKQLRHICILSGTDYNIEVNSNNNKTYNLYENMKYFKKYCNENSELEFCEWLDKDEKYLIDTKILMKINDIFDVHNTNYHFNICKFENIKITNCAIQRKELVEILKRDGFIFPVA